MSDETQAYSQVMASPSGEWVIRAKSIEALVSDSLETIDALVVQARRARLKAYAPYSEFKVGAALLSGERTFTGCNVENASYGATICAERVAIGSAVAAGHQEVEIIAITTGQTREAPIAKRAPCGVCLQVIAEFASPQTLVILDSSDDDETLSGDILPFSDLLPISFRLEQAPPK